MTIEKLIEKLEKESNGKPQLAAVADHIIAEASKSASYLAKAENWTLKAIFDKVVSKAKDYLGGKDGYIADSVVFGFVDSIVLDNEALTAKIESEEEAQKPAPTPKKKKEAKDDLQMSLFDFM